MSETGSSSEANFEHGPQHKVYFMLGVLLAFAVAIALIFRN